VRDASTKIVNLTRLGTHEPDQLGEQGFELHVSAAMHPKRLVHPLSIPPVSHLHYLRPMWLSLLPSKAYACPVWSLTPCLLLHAIDEPSTIMHVMVCFGHVRYPFVLSLPETGTIADADQASTAVLVGTASAPPATRVQLDWEQEESRCCERTGNGHSSHESRYTRRVARTPRGWAVCSIAISPVSPKQCAFSPHDNVHA